MRYLIVYILLVIFTDDINEIATINRVKDEAAKAYNDGDYGEAIKNYSFLFHIHFVPKGQEHFHDHETKD